MGSTLPLSKNLQRLLRDREITLADICAISGVAKSVAHGWVNGATPRDLWAVARLSDALHIDFRELLLGETDAAHAPQTKESKALTEREVFEHLCNVIVQKIKERQAL
jgi:transcriptional regulator with XRE-family HTH domain